MQKIIQLSPHISNLIAAGEVVDRPAGVVKELLENAVDAGASQITVEIRSGGMTFLRVTDNGCGMSHEDARTAFLRHATSKLRTAEDLAAITTMGFCGEALAAIASVSRVDIMTKTEQDLSGTSLTLEGGVITEDTEVGCPVGTTIIVRDLFFNTPARMKFMKSDSVEGGKISYAVQMQALAHPEVAFRFLRDGKEVLCTAGNGDLQAAMYCIYGKDAAKMVKVDSHWDQYTLTGYTCKPTDARPSRNMQTFFVNDRPVRSRLLIAALEEAYRNQIMVGKFPACVLHLHVPAHMVDVNVHPAKTEVKFLNEKAVFDCVHYGVLGALNKTPDRPQMQFKPAVPSSAPVSTAKQQPKQESFFRTMSAQEYKDFSTAIKQAPKPSPLAAAATAAAVERQTVSTVRETPIYPAVQKSPSVSAPPQAPQPVQQSVLNPEVPAWRFVGELYNSYILVEQGDEAYLIDKHAAHERIIFDRLRKNQESISSQVLLYPIPCRFSADTAAVLLTHTDMLLSLGFSLESFGENTVLVRQVPMDIDATDAADILETIAADLHNGRMHERTSVRDELLHTVACKAAIKAGWHTSEVELLALARQVMASDDLKYCPHGRPICISLSKKQLEKQFKRS